MTSTDQPVRTTPTQGRPDPDRVAALVEERDHLLASLDDLDREHAVGDMDDLDYATLKDDYTARAAEVLRAIEEQRAVVRPVTRSASPRRVLAVGAAVVAVAVVAGVLLAQASGQRGMGTITGNTGGLRQQNATCQMTAAESAAKGVTCYQKVLAQNPDNLEALTYQGWAYIRDGRIQRGAANLARAVAVDPSYPDVRAFRAIVLVRAGESAVKAGDAATARESFGAAAQELDSFYRNDPPQVAVQVLQKEGLERKIFFGLLDGGTLDCWQQAAAASPAGRPIDQQFLTALGTCLDGVLTASPDSADALLSKALTLVGPANPDVVGAGAVVARILARNPNDANALLLRASLSLAQGRLDDSQRDLDALTALRRPTGSFLIGSPEQLRSALATARAASTSTTAPTETTVAPSSVSTVPGAPAIPNAAGG